MAEEHDLEVEWFEYGEGEKSSSASISLAKVIDHAKTHPNRTLNVGHITRITLTLIDGINGNKTLRNIKPSPPLPIKEGEPLYLSIGRGPKPRVTIMTYENALLEPEWEVFT